MHQLGTPYKLISAGLQTLAHASAAGKFAEEDQQSTRSSSGTLTEVRSRLEVCQSYQRSLPAWSGSPLLGLLFNTETPFWTH
tara:strand:+ start:252 stop:497 length:246 start_codon:yes stop_codon:yes gene_type:complete